MTERLSDTQRRSMMAATVQPTPRGTGRRMILSIALYEGGHSAINSEPSTVPQMCNDDMELAAQVIMLIRKARNTRC